MIVADIASLALDSRLLIVGGGRQLVRNTCVFLPGPAIQLVYLLDAQQTIKKARVSQDLLTAQCIGHMDAVHLLVWIYVYFVPGSSTQIREKGCTVLMKNVTRALYCPYCFIYFFLFGGRWSKLDADRLLAERCP